MSGADRFKVGDLVRCVDAGSSDGQQQVTRYFEVGDRRYRITIPVEVKLTHTPQSKGGTVTAVVSGREKWTVEEVTG